MNRLVYSLSPHAHGYDTVERNMWGVVLALLPALLVSFAYFGVGAVTVCLTSLIACTATEWAITRWVLRRPSTISDGSAVITALLLAMNLPSNLPVWMVILGAFVAIAVGKLSYGGLGCNIFNPALVGRCFLLVSCPAAMTSWPVAGQLFAYTDAVTGATPLALMKWAIKSGDAGVLKDMPGSLDMLVGMHGSMGSGSMGELCGLALLVGMAFMLWRRIITWHIPVSILLTVAVSAQLMHWINPVYASADYVLFSGGLMLGAIFMATDYTTSPMTHRGQLIYGVAIGLLTLIIRYWGSYPEGMSFAILIMNAFTPLINYYVKPNRFGSKKYKKGGL